MLKDIERKLLRILSNYVSRHNKMPTMDQLETMSGKRKDQIFQALRELEKQEYIQWQNKTSIESIKILEAWERGTAPSRSANISRGANYWPMY